MYFCLNSVSFTFFADKWRDLSSLCFKSYRIATRILIESYGRSLISSIGSAWAKKLNTVYIYGIPFLKDKWIINMLSGSYSWTQVHWMKTFTVQCMEGIVILHLVYCPKLEYKNGVFCCLWWCYVIYIKLGIFLYICSIHLHMN